MVVDSSKVQRIPRLDTGKIHRHLEALSGMGSRWPSTPAERFAAEYMEDAMRHTLDAVSVEQFEYPLYIPVAAGFEVLSGINRDYPALGIQFSANDEAEAELVYIADGDSLNPGELIGVLKDKILITRTRKPYVVASVVEGIGVKGIVVISESPENTIRDMIAKVGYVQGTDSEVHRTSFPMVAVDAVSGRQLQELCAESRVIARLTHQSLQKVRRSRNVVGRIFGTSGRTIVVGAHYDSQLHAPGAWDNAAGCAVLLEMTRAARQLQNVHDIEFAAFGCEEPGIVGSSSYVERRRGTLDKILCYFNLDSVSSSSSTTLDVHASAGMERFAAHMVRDVCGLEPTSYNLFSPANNAQDSWPFLISGVECVWLHEEGNPCFHTPLDTVEKIDIERLARVGGAIWSMCGYLLAGGTS